MSLITLTFVNRGLRQYLIRRGPEVHIVGYALLNSQELRRSTGDHSGSLLMLFKDAQDRGTRITLLILSYTPVVAIPIT